MPELADLKSALTRLIEGRPAEGDQTLIRSSMEDNTLSIATGERAVAFGGDADSAVAVTGYGNFVLRVNALSSEPLGHIIKYLIPSGQFQLRPGLPDFEGREVETTRLLAVLGKAGGAAEISAVGGNSGIGKTEIAIHVGHQLADRYPDGQLFVELDGTKEFPLTPVEAMLRVVRSLQPTAAQLPNTLDELKPIYRDLLKDRRVLIVFDDAQDGEQVAPLIPSPPCGVIITSRRDIALLGLTPIALDTMSEREAITVLRSIVGEGRVKETELREIATLCGYLPLALRVAATFLQVNRVWKVREYIEMLSDERERLRRLTVRDHEGLDVAASLSLSVAQLRRDAPEIANRWYELSVFPGDFDLIAAKAVWECGQDEVREGLSTLVQRGMVLFDENRDQFRLHDLMRDIARGNYTGASCIPKSEGLERRLAQAALHHARHYFLVLWAAEKRFKQGNENTPTGLRIYDLEQRNDRGRSGLGIPKR